MMMMMTMMMVMIRLFGQKPLKWVAGGLILGLTFLIIIVIIVVVVIMILVIAIVMIIKIIIIVMIILIILMTARTVGSEALWFATMPRRATTLGRPCTRWLCHQHYDDDGTDDL